MGNECQLVNIKVKGQSGSTVNVSCGNSFRCASVRDESSWHSCKYVHKFASISINFPALCAVEDKEVNQPTQVNLVPMSVNDNDDDADD